MFKLFVLTLLCAAVLAQSEPSTNNGQESKNGESLGDRLNHIKEHVEEHIKEDMKNIRDHIMKHIEEHRQHHQQQPSPTTPNPTGTSISS